jgi:transposase-like protein
MAALGGARAGVDKPLLQPLDDFWSRFPDEEICIGRLKAARWKNGPVCPYCGDTRFYNRSDTTKHHCAGCQYTFSFKVGTLFQATTIPIRIWFAAIWILTNSSRGVSSVRLARDLGLRQNTAWSMLHRLRHAALTPAFARPIRRGPRRASTPETISLAPAAPTAGGGYDSKLKLDIAFDEAIERFAVVKYSELKESLGRSPRKRPSRHKSPARPSVGNQA